MAASQDVRHRLAGLPGQRNPAPARRNEPSRALQWQVAGGSDQASRQASDAVSGFGVRAETVSAGVDRRWTDDVAVGAALAVTRSRVRFDGSASAQRMASDSLTAYAQWTPLAAAAPALSLSLAASHEVSEFEVQRDGGAGRLARSAPKGSGTGLALTASHDAVLGAWSWSPYLRWDQVRVRVGAFQEAGSSDAVLVSAQTFQSSTLSGGANVQASLPQSWGLLVPYVRVEWSSRQDRRPSPATGRLLSDNSPLLIPAPGDESNRFGTVAVGLTAITQRSCSLFVDVQTGFAQQGYRIQRLGAGVRFEL